MLLSISVALIHKGGEAKWIHTQRVPPSAWDRQEGRMGTDSRNEGVMG